MCHRPATPAADARTDGGWRRGFRGGGWRPTPPAALLDLAFALYQKRRVNPDHTIDFLGTPWPITATARKSVGIIHHPGQRFWVVETLPDHRQPIWPNILAEYSL